VRRNLVAVLGTLSSLVLLLLYPTSHNAPVSTGSAAGSGASSGGAASAGAASGASTASTATSGTGSTGTKTYTGTEAQTQWGIVQVRITVKGGKVTTSAAVQYPNDNGHSQGINSYALPILAQQVVKAQSASIDGVSGATVTSNGYKESLQSALDAAHL